MQTSLIVLSLAILAVVAFATASDDRPTPSKTGGTSAVGSVQTYEVKQASQKLRVMLLGITKGVAFLESQELVSGDGRKHGNNVIPWLRVAVLVELLGDNPEPLGANGFEIRTPDGQELVEALQVQLPGIATTITSQATGVAQIDLSDSTHLALRLFPTASPEVEKPDRSQVLLLTVSGHVRDSHRAELLLKFGKEKFVFKNIPLP